MDLALKILSYIITFFSGFFVIEKVYKRFLEPIIDKCWVKHMFTYNNDSFAHDTIRYRFRDIIYTLNNFYEEAIVELRSGRVSDESLMELIKNRPFSYSKMMKQDFCEPTCLLNFLDKNKDFDNNDQDALKIFI